MSDLSSPRVPRIIWLLWLQGWDEASPLAQTCARSWELQNPDWTVRRLTRESLPDVLPARFCDTLLVSGLPSAKIANIVRLELIARHGGVWTDADVFCARPLDPWIDKAAASGFFAFRFEDADRWLLDESVPRAERVLKRTGDRVLANWFLAGFPGNLIAESIAKRYFNLLSVAVGNRKRSVGLLRNSLIGAMRRNAYLASCMGREAFVRRVGRYPYFLFHYHFSNLLRHDAAFREAWSKVEPHSAPAALAFSKTLGAPLDAPFQAAVTGAGDAPVYKFHSRRTAPLRPDIKTRYDWLQEQFADPGSP